LLEHLDDLLILHSFAYHLLKAVSSLYWTRWIFIYPLWSSMWSAQRGAPKHGSRSSSNQGFFYVLLSSNPSMIQTWYVPPNYVCLYFRWDGLKNFLNLPRQPLYCGSSKLTKAFVRSYKNLHFYWILGAGHFVSRDKTPVTLLLLI
jgi:hypothetical protein